MKDIPSALRFAATVIALRLLRPPWKQHDPRYASQKGITVSSKLDVKPCRPTDEGALQAVDYFLWALQRTYEKKEDRYLEMLWPQCSLIIDVDDKREADYGAYYTKQKPLTAAL